MRDSFIIYRSFYEAIKDLPPDNQLEMYNAICEYSLNLVEPELSGLSKTIFTLVKPQLDANIQRFKNGKKPKQKRNESETEAKDKQTESKTEANKNVNDNPNVNVNDNQNEKHLLFERFWNLYDKKVEAKKCKEKFLRLKDAEIEKIFLTLPDYIKSTPDVKFRKNPSTYLNNQCWNDEVVIHKEELRDYPSHLNPPKAGCVWRNVGNTWMQVIAPQPEL